MRIEARFVQAEADLESRTITGTVVPFGAVGATSAGPTVVAANAVTIPDRVPLLMSHDHDRPVGRMTSHSVSDDGITATFRVASTPSGDSALLEASEGIRDGLSVGMDVTASDSDDDGTLVVTAADLREVSLVTFPAFDAARVADVAAHRTTTPHPHPHTPAAPQPEPTKKSKRKETTVDDTTNPETVEASTVDPAPLVTAPARVTAEAFPYGTPSAAGRSMFRDMVNASHDSEAAQRFTRAQAIVTAAEGTTNLPEIVPPGYRPDLYVDEMLWGSPFMNAFSRYGITDPTPFKIPAFDSSTNLAADHSEGVNPTPGSLSMTELVVTPKAVSGSYDVTREMLDSANPSLDAIILRAMAEEYANHCETSVAAVIEAGATVGTAWPASGYSVALVGAMADFIGNRMAEADVVLAKPATFSDLATETDGSNRPMNPYIGATNADGTLGRAAGTIAVAGIPVRSAWSLTANVLVAKSTDAAIFASGMQSYRFTEVQGPGIIRFASFGYIGATVLRGSGVVKMTAA